MIPLDQVFSCPLCHGRYFGTEDVGETPWVRVCHDERQVKCRWKGVDGECFVTQEVADERARSIMADLETDE